MAETGKKMGDYTPLESNKKEYFFGDGEGGVVAVGKTEAGGKKTNRLVKLSDIAGNTEWSVTRNTSGNTPDIGINVGMAYDINIGGTSKLVNMYDSNVKAGYDPSAGGTSIEPPLHLGQLWFDDHSGHQENPDVYVATGTSRNSQWKLLHKGGGTTGQVLTKTATGETWSDVPKELPTSGTAGQFLKKTANGVEYASVNQVPTSGMNGDVLKKTASGYEFSDANEVPANGTEGDVLTKGAEGYSWAPRMLYKYDNKSEGDTVEITNKTITRMNIDVHSAITFNITTDDVTNMPNAIVEIFVDSGSSLTEIAFTLSWTITSGDYAGVRTLYCPASGNTVQVNAGDRLQIHIYDQCWNAFRFIQPVSPTPSYEYIILQNFVAGHSIGTPTSTSPSSFWLDTVLTPEQYVDYEISSDVSRLVDTTVGHQCIDSSDAIDFSKYGINTGIPCAMMPSYANNNEVGFALDTNSMKPLTVEVFVLARQSGKDIWSGSKPIIVLGCDHGTDKHDVKSVLMLEVNDSYWEFEGEIAPEEECIQLHLQYEGHSQTVIGGFHPDEAVSAGSISGAMVNHWTHFAVCIDTTNIYVFYNGKCYLTIPLSTSVTVASDGDGGTITRTLSEYLDDMDKSINVGGYSRGTGYGFDAEWAQLAVCKACKWTTDFTVPTEAY